jgi:cytochrome c peroxidase
MKQQTVSGGPSGPGGPLHLSRRRLRGTLLAALLLCAAAGTASIAYLNAPRPPRPPLGLPEAPWPRENPYSRAKAELGRLLFFDPRLSSDGTVSCASCHEPNRAFADGKRVSTGIEHRKGKRNAPALLNLAYGKSFFWDGRASTLEEQAEMPLANRDEMTTREDPHQALEGCAARLRAIPGYRRRFRRAFGTERIELRDAARALATFERTLFSGDSPYDFNKAPCFSCHPPPTFTTGEFAGNGIGMRKPDPDLGHFSIVHLPHERGLFKTPSLREVEHTAPYMHDGSIPTLSKVVEHYATGGRAGPFRSGAGGYGRVEVRLMEGFVISPSETADLVAFLESLTDEEFLNNPAFGDPHIK